MLATTIGSGSIQFPGGPSVVRPLTAILPDTIIIVARIP